MSYRRRKTVIHQYINNGYYIVLDVNSGSVHSVDPLLYDVISFLSERIPDSEKPFQIAQSLKDETAAALKEKYSQEEIREAFEDIQELIDQEELFTADIYKNFVMDFKKRQTVVKALCLHIAHDCNLACQYCFAEEGEYHGRRALMTFEVGKKALDFLIANSGNRRNLEVDFFGGEPLMNWQVVKQLVEYGRSQEEAHNKKFRFTLTTNGVLLNDEIMEFCNREMSNVVLSLDGRKEVNDKMRPFRNGTGSYDLIVPKFQKFAEKRGDRDYFVRGTFTHNNLDFGKDVLHFADLGFKKMSVEPVVAPDEEPYAIKEADLPQILEEYDRLAAEYVKRHKEGRGFTFFHFMLDLTQGPCVAKRLSGCGSGTGVSGSYPVGRPLSVPSVCRKRRFLARQRGYGRDQHGSPRRVQASAMSMRKTNVGIALPDFTAVAAVRPIPTTSTVPSRMRMISGAMQKNVSSARSCDKSCSCRRL